MTFRWPEAVGERLSLTWEGEGATSAIVEAAAERYFELTGVLAAAHTLGVGPALYRRTERGLGVLVGPAEVSVEIVGLRRRCAVMVLQWRAGESSGRAEIIWCWRDSGGRAVRIPEAARIGILALDGPRIPVAQRLPVASLRRA